MAEAVIVEAVRSPVGKRNGGLSGVHPGELSAQVLNGLAERAGIDPEIVDDVIWGCVMQAGEQALDIAPHRGAGGGLAGERPRRDRGPAVRIQPAVHSLRGGRRGGRALRRGGRGRCRVDVAHADGRLTGQRRAPVPRGVPQPLQPDPEPGHRRRDDRRAVGLRPHRARRVLAGSHEKAAAAQDSGAFDDQIVAIKDQDGNPVLKDEGIRRGTTIEKMGELKPAFKEDGVIHAGNSSQISDGSAALLFMSAEKAKSLGLKPIAKVHTATLAGADPVIMLTAPIPATQKALKKSGPASSRTSACSRSTRRSLRCRWPG